MSLTADIIQHTIAIASAHLAYEAGGNVLAAARQGGAAIVDWLRARLPADAAKPLADLQANPEDDLNRQDLAIQLAKYLRANPTAEAELRALLPSTTTTTTQTASHNSGSTIVQNTGSGSITIQR